MDKYFWSFNEHDEHWGNSGETVEECIEEAKEYARDYEEEEELKQGEIDSIYIGEIELFKAEIYGDDVLDSLRETSMEQVGESSEGWLDGINREDYERLGDKLTTVLNEWLVEVSDIPTFGTIENIKEYKLK